MKRSKLEMYVDILKALAQSGPMQLTDIICQANVNSNILKENLGFLIKQGLIESIDVGHESFVYANTDRGTAVMRFFGQLGKNLPVNEADKFLPVSY